MLLKSGADTNLALSDGKTPLHISAESGTIAVFRHLLTNGADPWKQDKVGFIEDFHDRTTSLYNPFKRIFFCSFMILGWRNSTPQGLPKCSSPSDKRASDTCEET